MCWNGSGAKSKQQICVDLTQLNKSVCRETSTSCRGTDTGLISWCQSFHQVGCKFEILANTSRECIVDYLHNPVWSILFCRLLFGIMSAPKHFQRRMLDLLSGLDGVVCMIDNILVHGCPVEKDDCLTKVLQRLEETGLTLNQQKCQFLWSQVKFLRQVVNWNESRSDTERK